MIGKKLNRQQKEAVMHGEGPLLVIAGAGTGKTTAIVERIKYLVTSKKAIPEEVLALTFTEKAAAEMQERIDDVMPLGYSNMWVSTFHAFCDRVLRAEALAIGLTTDYHLMTEAENIAFLKRHLFQFDLEYFRPLGNPTKFLEGLLQHFSRLQDEDITPAEYLRWLKKQPNFVKTPRGEELELQKWRELTDSYQKYEALKIKDGVFDYGDLLAKTLLLFRKRPNILKEYQSKFKYILIDEFQDTNYSQFQLSILLAGKKANITVVGDDDQSIYRFRGASISNIIQFRKYFPTTKVVVLTANYRSGQRILDHAYKLIQFNNPDRLEVVEKISKKLIASGNKKRGVVELIHTRKVEEEADAVAKKITSLTKKGYSWKDCAVLVRANNHADVFIKTFERIGIPFQFLGPGKLFSNSAVSDLVAYLKVLYSYEDSLSLYKVLSNSFFGISQKDLIKWNSAARRQNISLFELLETEANGAAKQVVTIIKRQLDELKVKTPGQLLYDFSKETRFLQYLLGDSENIEDATSVARFFEKLKQFENENTDVTIEIVVDWITLSSNFGEPAATEDADWTENNAVNIMSIHASKGLEFRAVFLVNLVSQRFPTTQRKEQIPIPTDILKEVLPRGDYHLQEERRLFYVGMTRACDQLYFTAADFYGGDGGRQKKISQFVWEAMGRVSSIKYQVSSKNQEKQEKKRVAVGVLRVKSLSYSQIETFQACPMHYKLKYLLRIQAPSSAAQSFGVSVHKTLQQYYEDPKKDILTILKENWINEGYLDKKHEGVSFKRAEDYLKGFPVKTIGVPTYTEHSFEFRIEDLKVNGVFDRVDLSGDEIEIVDYKTSENVPTQKDVDKNFQLTIYALAASELFNKNPEQIKLSLYYFENQKRITTTRTRQQLLEAKNEILQIRAQIERSDFTCSHGFFCQNCEYSEFCRAR